MLGRHSETLKAIRRLRRRQGDHALLEGPHLVGEALELGLELETVLVTASFLESSSGRDLARRLRRPPLEIGPDLLASLADADAPRGVLAVASLPRGGAESLPRRADGLYVFLDGVQEPGNVGAVARVAEAFGAVALVLAPGCAHPNHPRGLRASAGSLLRLPTAIDVSVSALDAVWSGAPPTWAVLATRDGRPLGSGGEVRPLVVALGAEGPGLSATVVARAELAWSIPLAGRVESLNVAVAAGIALHALARS